LPYDPHSFAQGWIDGNGGEGIFPAMVNFTGTSSREELLDMVKEVLQEDDPRTAKAKWSDIHKYCMLICSCIFRWKFVFIIVE